MPSVLIFGGSGQVARLITKELIEKGDIVHSVIRNPAQSESLIQLGAKPVVQSVEDSSVAELTSMLKKISPDVIIWSAGAGGSTTSERTRKVDYEAAVKSFDAAAAAGVKRYIMVSAADTRDRENKPVPTWYGEADKQASDMYWSVIGDYAQAKLDADRDLVTRNKERGLHYSIARPTWYGDVEGSGKIAIGKVPALSAGKIARSDVASAVVAAVYDDGTIGRAFDIAPGDTPIKDAIARVGKEGIDTFEGYY
jgi:nucleoside-diphosphate-sugar epimerase